LTLKGEIVMKNFGKGLCIAGSILAILFLPLSIPFLGFQTFGFILGNAGFGIKNFQLLDMGILCLELILINGVGLALFIVGKKQENKNVGHSEVSATPQETGFKFCGHCGVKLAAEAVFCSGCGEKTDGGAS
jgi:hypothetical protein